MTPKEVAEKIEKGIAGIPRWRMFWDFKVGDLADFVADYKRQSELLEEARKLACQYRDDLRHPPTPDSRERRLRAIEAVISKIEGV